MKKLKNVYIFTTISDSYEKSHFLNVSGLNWELTGEFYNGNIKVGLFKLIKSKKELKEKLNQLQTINENNKSAQEYTQIVQN